MSELTSARRKIVEEIYSMNYWHETGTVQGYTEVFKGLLCFSFGYSFCVVLYMSYFKLLLFMNVLSGLD